MMISSRHLERGSLEPAPGGVRIWKAGAGYLSKNGGFTKKERQALVASGPGEAIRLAAVHGFAITGW